MTGQSTVPIAGSTAAESGPRVATGRFVRSRTNRVFAGVCGGIAEQHGSDPTAVRIAAVVLGLFTGIVPLVVVYIVAALVVPTDGDASGDVRTGVTSRQAAVVVGIALVLVGVAGFVNVWLDVDWDQLWPLALIGLGAVMLLATLRPRA